ncbi:MAG TPA: hypothetical protein VFL27_12070 [Candidatus Dormibacteraeota bacterium]|nr:hypothetical protein [Candidatus Dormibacteraeota bacterium]
MSANPEVEGIVTLPALEPVPMEVVAAPAAAPFQAAPRRSRPSWIAPVAIAVVGVIASGTLGYFLYATMQQRDGLHARLVSAQTTLTAAQQDAASKKVTATYVAMYVADEGKVQTDYQTIVVCDNYSTCRTAAQQLLTDLQAFQADRKAANVPSELLSTDSSTGDAISAAIAGDQEFIVGIDNGDDNKAKEGGQKVDQAMLSLDKAEASLGSQLK